MTISLLDHSLFSAQPMASGIPTLIVPAQESLAIAPLIAQLSGQLDGFRDRLIQAGALLLRGFGVRSMAEFEALCQACSPQLRDYVGGGSPRRIVKGKIYKSTEYPAQLPIVLHSEGSYLKQMPETIFFFCEQPPRDRGETPIGDMRRVLAKIPGKIRDKFAEKGVKYLSNLHGGKGLGRSWQDTFLTSDRGEVEKILTADGYEYAWQPDGSLRTSIVCPGVRRHPVTGVEYWGNQAINWHPSQLEPEKRQFLEALYGQEWLPKNATYGDGEPIPDEEIDCIRQVLALEEVVFGWQQGDILICDNHAIAHGRQPFSGERRILVAIA